MSDGPCDITLHPPCIIKEKQSLAPVFFIRYKPFKKKRKEKKKHRSVL